MTRTQFWRYTRALFAPVLLWIVVLVALFWLLPPSQRGDDSSDEKALHEWLDEAGARDNLPKMVRDYLDAVAQWQKNNPQGELSDNLVLRLYAEKIEEHL